MYVRTAGRQDIDTVRALLVETWHATYDPIYGPERVTAITEDWHSVEALTSNLARLNAEFILADDGSAIAGMAYAASIDEGKTVRLHQLYVLPAFQGRGVGKMLLDEIVESFPEARRVVLEVEEQNLPAIAFYKAHGFVLHGRTANCGKEQSGIPALVLERTM